MNRRYIRAIGVALALSFALGCGASSAETESSQAEVKASFVFKSTGIAKYDTLLQTTKDITGNLDRATSALENIVPSIKDAVAGLGAVMAGAEAVGQAEDFGAVMTALFGELEKAKIKMTVTVSGDAVMLGVAAMPGGDEGLVAKVQAAFDGVNAAIATIRAVPESLASVVADAQSLVPQIQGLVQSAPQDFTGMNAMKLPAATEALAKAGEELAKVPEKVPALIEAAATFMGQLSALGQ